MNPALTHADFRRLVAGRAVTNAGDSLYTVAAMWLVYDLTGSSLHTGLAGALTGAPVVLQAFAGPLVDRWSARRVLAGTQLLQALLVLAVPAAHLLDVLSVALVLTVMPLVSLCNQFAYPAQSTLVPRLVPREDLVGANSAMSLAYQGVNAGFNAAAGVVVAAVGAVAVFALDAVTFLLAAGLFASIVVPRERPDAPASRSEPGSESCSESGPAVADGGRDSGYLAELREGFGFLRRTVLLPLLVGAVAANVTLAGTMAVLPAFADGRGGAGAYGLLLACLTGGLLAGALLAGRVDGLAYGRLSVCGFLAAGTLWLAALAVPGLLATGVLLACAMVPVGVVNVVTAAMVQSLVPDALLGRVTAASRSVAAGVAPLGSLAGGAAAAAVGPAPVVAAAGVGLLLAGAFTLSRPELRSLPPARDVETLAA